MYDSLKIEGFRAFDSFDLPNLTRVNLLVGKNNAGKTSLLDAVEMVALGGKLASLWSSPMRRREIWPEPPDQSATGWDVDLSHLFHGHQIRDGVSFKLSAGDGNTARVVGCSIRPNKADPAKLNPLIDLVGVGLPFELVMTGPDNPEGKPPVPIGENGFLFGSTANLTRGEAPKSLLPPNDKSREGVGALASVSAVISAMRKDKPLRVWFLGTEGAPPGFLQAIWDLLVLSPEEDKVISALQIIEPAIQRLAFIGQGSQSTAFVKLMGEEQRMPLGSLGDGMKRLLAQAIYMTFSAKGVLLIDEIDTGLHYTTLESMWRFVIESARRLDVQVFATSHSGDCIRALAWLQTDAPDLAAEVSVHRIDRTEPAAVRYSAADIEIAARHHIEVRG